MDIEFALQSIDKSVVVKPPQQQNAVFDYWSWDPEEEAAVSKEVTSTSHIEANLIRGAAQLGAANKSMECSMVNSDDYWNEHKIKLPPKRKKDDDDASRSSKQKRARYVQSKRKRNATEFAAPSPTSSRPIIV